MNKILGTLCFFFGTQLGFAQSAIDLGTAAETTYDQTNQLGYVRFNPGNKVSAHNLEDLVNQTFFTGNNKAVLYKTETDQSGFIHYRFKIQNAGSVYANKMLVVHVRNGELVSINGDLTDPAPVSNASVLNEKSALAFALKKVGAEKYKWENREELAHMREVMKDPDFSFDPKGEKVIFENDGQMLHACQRRSDR
jgi:Zn-dependent metalloprotease